MKIPFRTLIRHPANFFSLGFGSGLSPKAPGTVGSLLAWGLYVLMRDAFSFEAFCLFVLAAFVIGVWLVSITGRQLGVVDHGGIVWDEFVAVWLVLLLTPATLIWQAAAVAIFRLFDITKPWPIRQFERHYKNGFGVMADDILAAIYSLIMLLTAQHFWA